MRWIKEAPHKFPPDEATVRDENPHVGGINALIRAFQQLAASLTTTGFEETIKGGIEETGDNQGTPQNEPNNTQ